MTAPQPVPPWVLSAPACSVPSAPLGTGGLCHLLGWLDSCRCQGKRYQPNRPDQRVVEGPKQEGVMRRRRRRPCREPCADRASSGDVITGTNSSLAQRRFPAAGSTPVGSGPPQGQPWSRNSLQRLHQLSKEGSSTWPAQSAADPEQLAAPATRSARDSLHPCKAAGGPTPKPAP